MKKAAFQQSLDKNRVECRLCPHRCRISESGAGICLTRKNHGGILYSENFSRPISTAVDPIEKKPLYHFKPGSRIFSTGPNGCTFACAFCQNADIAQKIVPARLVEETELITAATAPDVAGIAYTYSEPYIWFETIMAIGPTVRRAGKVNVMVTNGFMEPSPLDELLGVVDAFNVDIKSMDPAFYRRQCKGRLEPVLRSCERIKKSAHLEITNLLITDLNDSEEAVHSLVRFMVTHLGADTPLHLSRYFPRFRMDAPATPESRVLRAWEIAADSLQYVYVGNMTAGRKADSVCHACGEELILRSGYKTTVRGIIAAPDGNATCGACGTALPFIL